MSKPLHYRTTSFNILSWIRVISCLVFSMIVGYTIMFWHIDTEPGCFFYTKIDPEYYFIFSLVGVFFPTVFVFLAYGMIFFRIRVSYYLISNFLLLDFFTDLFLFFLKLCAAFEIRRIFKSQSK